MNEKTAREIDLVKLFAKRWNELYAAGNFEEMKYLATEDVAIANAPDSTDPSGLIFGREAYYDGIIGAYGKQGNLLVMEYEGWEYVPLGENMFYTIGRYSLQNSDGGVNCWLLRRDTVDADWQVFRVINTLHPLPA